MDIAWGFVLIEDNQGLLELAGCDAIPGWSRGTPVGAVNFGPGYWSLDHYPEVRPKYLDTIQYYNAVLR